MLYTYPSNRLENLVTVLDTLLLASPKLPLQTDIVLVQHPGMQHWLSMSLANLPHRSICMNTEYPLPVRYFWDLIRCIIGHEQVPKRSIYTREILAWRIYRLLEQEALASHPLMREPTQYWQKQSASLQASRRFQLSEELADLYEQYLMYRPHWIEQWEAQSAEHWQALLWQQLVAQDPNHPLRLMKKALAQIKTPASPLPPYFFMFGINTLAPIWLDFIASIAEQTETDVHILYLNPSAEHWDDLRSDKYVLKQAISAQKKSNDTNKRANWLPLEEVELELAQAGNPLLTSLGLQGQAFVRLLSEKLQIDTPAFSDVQPTSILRQIQRDLLTANDARINPQQKPMDNSLCITSAHSALREVQGLHDWLLHQFNNDPSLTPKDVLVMCPNVEDYAPFVQAIFGRSFIETDNNKPQLPCSIADRNLKGADPTVAVFLELLTLPDARFSVNQIMSWLRVSAIADKFELSPADLTTIQRWLHRANVHWAFDAEHKKQWSESDTTHHFTWQQGLDRLLLGFAYSDESAFVNDTDLLEDVEGSQAILLGKLVHIIEQLYNTRSQLTAARTPAQWQQYLLEQLQQALLSADTAFERSNQTILTAINNLTEFANRAGLQDEAIPLSIIRLVLEKAFTSPEATGSQFMTGQITVCSMVPMRSIPFKVIAILGLNDGQFPRQRPPLGFDLMAKSPVQMGDRSRRGDDRYLFLEAILSVRDSLYLSYQGFDIKKNEALPPSLILTEVVDYITSSFDIDKKSLTYNMPLQAYSSKNHLGSRPSFEAPWQKLATNTQEQRPTLAPTIELPEQWRISQWVQFFSHPAKFFSEYRLGLYFQGDPESMLEDTEPFTLSHLDRYFIQQDVIEHRLQKLDTSELLKTRQARSAIPLHQMAAEQAEGWQQTAKAFSDLISQDGAKSIIKTTVSVELADPNFKTNGVVLSGDLPLTNDGQLVHWRLANMKGRDLINSWLLHLLINTQQPTSSVGFYRGKKDTINKITLPAVSNALKQLNHYYTVFLDGLNTPLLLNADFLLPLLEDKDSDKDFNKIWQSTQFSSGLGEDPYMAYFWHDQPNAEPVFNNMRTLYNLLLETVVIESVVLEEVVLEEVVLEEVVLDEAVPDKVDPNSADTAGANT